MYRSVLVPLDGSAFAEQALPLAIEIARRSGGRLTLARVWDASEYLHAGELVPAPVTANAPERTEAVDYLDALAARLSAAGAPRTDTVLLEGRAADALEARASLIGADLIVMTTHGRTGLSRAWLGSTADAIVRRTTIPVLLWRSSDRSAASLQASTGVIGRILVAIDGSEAAESILPHAMGLGRLFGAPVTLLRVVGPVATPIHPYAYAGPPRELDAGATGSARAHAEEYLRAVSEQFRVAYADVRLETEVVVDEHPASAILRRATESGADLVAMTTHARRGTRLFLGSVTDGVLRGTTGAMLVLHPPAD
jgi:nucleotide-binding universal stress UspA family protein